MPRTTLFVLLTLGLANPAALCAQPNLEDFLDSPARPSARQEKSLPPGARVLWAPQGNVAEPAWTSDSRQTVCLCDADIWTIDVATGAPARLRADPGPKSTLLVLPGGRFLYVSGQASGRRIRLLSPADNRDLPLAAGWNPDPSPDAGQIVFDSPDGPATLSLIAKNASPVRLSLPATLREDAQPRFTTGNRIVFCQEGNVLIYDLDRRRLDVVARQNMTDLTYYGAALPCPDGRRLALFSTNASALSKPASAWLLAGQDAQELGPGRPLQWIGAERLLILRSGALWLSALRPEILVPGAAAGAASPDAAQLAFCAPLQDTNADGQVDARDAASLCVMPLPP